MDGPAARYKIDERESCVNVSGLKKWSNCSGPSWVSARIQTTRRKTSKGHLGTQKLSLNLNVGFMTRCNTSLEATDAALASDHIYHGALGI